MERRTFLTGACASAGALAFSGAGFTRTARAQGLAAGDPLRTCGTVHPTVSQTRQVESAIQGIRKESFPLTRIRVPTHLHVIHNGPDGFVTEQQIAQQMNVLNAEFAPVGADFPTASVTYHNEPDLPPIEPLWHAQQNGRPDIDLAVKSVLGRDVPVSLNIYVARLLPGTLLGYASFPWQLETEPARDGVVVASGTLPGGDRCAFRWRDDRRPRGRPLARAAACVPERLLGTR